MAAPADRPRTARAARYPEGAPCWTDAMLPDVEAGKRFYGELFGWSFGAPASASQSYAVARRGEAPVAGLFAKPDGRLPSVWNLYLATGDIEVTAAEIRSAGGRILMEPTDVAPFGVTATAADPSGAVFGLWQAGELGGFAVRGEPGTYVWCEVRTRDAAAVDPFYAHVFGYATSEVGGGVDFLVWAPAGEPVDEEHAVGGRYVLDESYPRELPAHFLTYFAVADCDDAAHATVRLGGRVAREPQDTPYGRIAQLVDNQGAYFAVLQPPATGGSAAA